MGHLGGDLGVRPLLRRAIVLAVQRQPDANTVDVVDRSTRPELLGDLNPALRVPTYSARTSSGASWRMP